MRWGVRLILLCMSVCGAWPAAGEPPALTSLSDPAVRFRVPDKPYVVLRRCQIEAVVADNRAVNDDLLPGHRAGYSGIASLKHARRPENLFVPLFAGLNFEHIHDGTVQPQSVLFEPRNGPLELRQVDQFTAELYQKPSPHYGLESCLRYHLLEDGTIEMTVECVPRQRSFRHGYVGLFWASYIHRPESLDIHFRGHAADQPAAADWMRGATPAHGELATHLASNDLRQFAHDAAFPLTLVFNLSRYRYSEPWYYGVSHGMALALMFRTRDQVRLSQSPSGGGTGNPAWDFQYLIPNYEAGKRYQMVMRAMYLPYQSPEQVDRATRPHRLALDKQ
jgi:hypothetical protein